MEAKWSQGTRAEVAEKWLSRQAGSVAAPLQDRSPNVARKSHPMLSAAKGIPSPSPLKEKDSQAWSGAHSLPSSPVSPFVNPGSLNSGVSRSAEGADSLSMSQDDAVLRASASPPDNLHPSSESERLYEAYSELHSLANDFNKPFSAPAILVVGHQTDGKSALVEALIGFQFNSVGGGTKTRRPVCLNMKYNPDCTEPRCFLVTDDRVPHEEEKSLSELQIFIEDENMRLAKDGRQFWEKEIVVRIEYKYCPNLTIIDTPGLIAAAPGRKNALLQAQAREVENLVRKKMQQKEMIILCLEDCSDWSNATTRRVVMQMDPEMSRTVVVSTKLDTRIPQFARAADVELFLRPPPRLLETSLGGAPFFTSVPSGRVGFGRDAVYQSDDHFREAVGLREGQDVHALQEKLDRALNKEERSRVGVRRLRWFLEHLLQQRYMESVPNIMPLLDREYKSVEAKLSFTVSELSDLDGPKLKERGRAFRDAFLQKIGLLVRGTIAAPPEKFGESLQDERALGGAFIGIDGQQLPSKYMPNATMRLYGGAQYHRAMAEFRFVVGGMKCPHISREEIVNACGVEDIHDGTNYFRTACVIAVSKARDVFEPFLNQLGTRLSHVLRRLLPVAMFLLQKDGDFLVGKDMFVKRVGSSFGRFVDSQEKWCRGKCMEDLESTTRYVTWSLHNKNNSGLRSFLNNLAASDQQLTLAAADAAVASANGRTAVVSALVDGPGPVQTPQARLVDLLESTLWNRRLAPTSEDIVNALVSQIFEGIRDHFVAAAELKFNCFFLMPLIDKFPAMLREDLESALSGDIDSVFDVAQTRRALEEGKADLELELRRVEKLQEKFANVHHHLSRQSTPPPPSR